MPHALITGGSRRLGLFVTEKLLNLGWQVSVLTRTASEGLGAIAGDRLTVFEVDYSDSDAVLSACQNVAESGVDLVLHNASYFQKDAAVGTESNKQLTKMLHVHAALPSLINDALSDTLKASNNGNIIHMTDIYVANPNPEYSNYCAAKAALENLSLSYAKRLAPKIRVNTIQPGALMFLPDHTEEAKTKVLDQSLLQIEAGFEPIWQTVQYILQNSFLTGTPIKVDGGRAISR